MLTVLGGNPGGRPKEEVDIRKLARSRGKEAIDTSGSRGHAGRQKRSLPSRPAAQADALTGARCRKTLRAAEKHFGQPLLIAKACRA
jgi:hypothetical protein